MKTRVGVKYIPAHS